MGRFLGISAHKMMVNNRKDMTQTKIQDKQAASPSPESFEVAIAELEKIIATMERGDLPLEESLTSYKRGAALIEYCRSSLAKVEQQVSVLEADLLKPYE
jgi:exodeoxyribonuclease VII small subunit